MRKPHNIVSKQMRQSDASVFESWKCHTVTEHAERVLYVGEFCGVIFSKLARIGAEATQLAIHRMTDRARSFLPLTTSVQIVPEIIVALDNSNRQLPAPELRQAPLQHAAPSHHQLL